MRNIVVILIPLFVCFFPHWSYAQSAGELVFSPDFPSALEPYTVTVNQLYDPNVTITWIIDGVENTAATNKNTFAFTAKGIGVPTVVVAKITRMDRTNYELRRTIIPSRIDMVVEADTVVPAFYNGRRLPSSGSTISAKAVVFAKQAGPFSYLWSLNGKVQNGGIASPKSSVTFVTAFENEALVSVTVLDGKGNSIGKKSQIVPIVEPELYFYEKNPLRGLSFVALPNPHIFIGEELVVRAEGYFMTKDLVSSNVLREWKINSKKILSNSSDPNEITLQKAGNSGSSKLSFKILNLQQLLQGVEKTVGIQF